MAIAYKETVGRISVKLCEGVRVHQTSRAWFYADSNASGRQFPTFPINLLEFTFDYDVKHRRSTEHGAKEEEKKEEEPAEPRNVIVAVYGIFSSPTEQKKYEVGCVVYHPSSRLAGQLHIFFVTERDGEISGA